MKKLTLLFIVTLFACDIENTEFPEDNIMATSIEGKTYELTSYVIENNVDLNGDNVFSLDLLEEDANCFVDELFFDENNLFWPPNRSTIAFTIENGSQSFYCVQPDSGQLIYSQEEDVINVINNEQLHYSGVLTDDYNTLTFVIPFQYLFGFGFFGENDYLDENGMIQEYVGNATLTYQLVE